MEAKTIQIDDLGCSHYRRKCQLVAPCCGKAFTCRFCHDEAEDHTMKREEVMTVVCLKCETKQEVGASCSSCNIVFGKYFCSVCRLYDDEDKGQFHCEGCGICRVGGRSKYFHCSKCDICLRLDLQQAHKCVEKTSRGDCPVCLEHLHTSREPYHVLQCGHMLHRGCFIDLIDNGNYCCPLCAVSMVSMTDVWERIDEQISATPMPEEYANKQVGILCRDCHKDSMVLFHVIGLKCSHCGSYNTCRGRDVATPDPVPQPSTTPVEVHPRNRLQSALMYVVAHRERLQDSLSGSMQAF